jgi:DNA-binding MarR family transcriptional regulator
MSAWRVSSDRSLVIASYGMEGATEYRPVQANRPNTDQFGPAEKSMKTSVGARIYTKPGFLSRQLHRVTAAIFAEETASFDLTGLQYGILNVIDLQPGMDQISVCAALGIDRSTLAGVVDRLEEKGLLKRSPGPTDRRANALNLTRAGKRILAEMEDAALSAESRAFEPLSASEQRQFARMLTKIVEHHAHYAGMPSLAQPATPKSKTSRARRAKS